MPRSDAIIGTVRNGKVLISLTVLLVSALGLTTQAASAAPLPGPVATAPAATATIQPAQFGVYIGVGPGYDYYDDGYRYGYYDPYYYDYTPAWRYRYYYRSYGSRYRNPYYERRSGIRHERSPN